MNDPIVRDVEYYLDWLAKFRQRIEDDKAADRTDAKILGERMPEHPIAGWLIQQATWEGIGVLKWKAQNPDWRALYRATKQVQFPEDENPNPNRD